MAEDEEEMAEAGEVEKRRMHQCSECGKSYKHEHKLKHHKTWLCKERALDQVQSEPRRQLSSNFFQLPTIPEGEEVFPMSDCLQRSVQCRHNWFSRCLKYCDTFLTLTVIT